MSTSTQFATPMRKNAKATKSAQKPIKVNNRATVSLSSDSAAIVERFKAATGLSTSRAIEELILRSEPSKPRIKMINGLAVFDVKLKNGAISDEEIRKLEDQPW